MMQPRFHYLVSVIGFAITVLILCIPLAKASDWFNPSLLQGETSAVEKKSMIVDDDTLQRLANGQQPPGTYLLDMYVNNHQIGRRNVDLTVDGPNNTLTPVLSINEVLAFGVKSEIFANERFSQQDGNTVINGILNNVPGTQVYFDFPSSRLNITIPDILMVKETYGATDPRFWDNGITALVTDYNFTASQSETQTISDSSSAFLSMTNHFNKGGWRVNNFSTWTRSENKNDEDHDKIITQRWDSVNTWVSRPIPQLRGMFSAGDYYTPSDIFDSFQFQGMQLTSDEDMNPDYLNDFSPVIRGSAAGNAQVTIRQNGNIVYQTTVPPGPFSISDIPSSSQSGDYFVTIREADGTERSFIQGNSSVAVMQREGELRYAFTGGRLREDSNQPEFAQGTIIYGLPNDLTVFGGLQSSRDYYAGNIGVGTLFGVVGAFSVDLTHSKADYTGVTSEQFGGAKTGQSWRVRYSKSLAETGSTLTASFNHYTREYWNLSDVYAVQSSEHYSISSIENSYVPEPVSNDRPRDEAQVSLSQNMMGNMGSVGLNASSKKYYDLDGQETSISVNWNVTMGGVGLGFGYQVNKWIANKQEDERLVSLIGTIPLQQWLGTNHAIYSSSSYTKSDSGKQILTNTVGGSLLGDNNLSWNIGQSSIHSGGESGDNNNATLGLSYSGGQGRISGGYSYSPDSKQYDIGVQGGVMLTRYGLTLSQSPGDTMALIHVPDANDITIRNGTGISTDRFGNAVVSVQPYQRNKIDLDLLTAGENITLTDTSRVVIPIRGAVVLAYYETAIGYQILMKLSHQGSPLPFGTIVSLMQGQNTLKEESRATGGNGIIGDAGQVWMAGMPEEGILHAVWGEGADRSCRINYKLSGDAIRTAKKQHLPVMTTGECS